MSDWMGDIPDFRVCAHYPGQQEPIWCDTLEEALTYMNAENAGRGLPPFTSIKVVFIKGTEDTTLS